MRFGNLIDILPQCHIITLLSSPNGAIMFFCQHIMESSTTCGWLRSAYDKAAMNYHIVEYVLKVQKNDNIEPPKATDYRALARPSC